MLKKPHGYYELLHNDCDNIGFPGQIHHLFQLVLLILIQCGRSQGPVKGKSGTVDMLMTELFCEIKSTEDNEASTAILNRDLEKVGHFDFTMDYDVTTFLFHSIIVSGDYEHCCS